MSLKKAILHGKEKRKPYHGPKSFFPSCRNHGCCPWCKGNRLHKFRDKHPDELDVTQTKSCWYKAVVGIEPDKQRCKQLHPNGCDDCSFFLEDPPVLDDGMEDGMDGL